MTPWKRCLEQLEGELTTQQFDTWIRPLHAIEDNNTIQLLAPNRFVQDWIGERYLSRIEELLSNKLPDEEKISVKLDVGSRGSLALTKQQKEPAHKNKTTTNKDEIKKSSNISNNLNPAFTFNSFVEGKSNQLARAASLQVSKNPGGLTTRSLYMAVLGLVKPTLCKQLARLF